SGAEDAGLDLGQAGSDAAESLSTPVPATDASGRELLPKPALDTGDGVAGELGASTEESDTTRETASALAVDSEQDAIAKRPDDSAGETSAMDSPDSAADPQSASSGLFGFLSPATALVSPWALASGLGVIVIGGLGLFAYRRRRSLADIEPESLSLDLDLDSAPEEAETPYAGAPTAAVSDSAAQPYANAEAEPKADSDDALVRSLEDAFEDGETLSIELDSVTESELDVGPALPVVEAEPAADGRPRRPLGTGSNGERVPASSTPVTQETDLVAEADIYILYGRYREAESILLDALANSPKRAELRYKLAEAYIGGENREALAALMDQMESAGEDGSDPARWFAMRQELSRMQAASGVAERPAGAGAAAAAGTAAASEALGPKPEPDSEEEGQEITLEVDVDGIDPLGSLDFGDSEIVGAGVLENEADQVPVDRPLDQEDELALDLRDLDMLGELSADTRDATGAPRTEAPVAPVLELPPDATESSAAPRDDGAPIEFSDNLDLDFGALDRLAGLEEVDTQRDDTLPDPHSLEDDGLGVRAEAEAEDRLRLEVPSESGIWDEVATKMDLARAYIEMEDPDAARAILKEVLGEGDEAQQGEAKTLLATLG
ncbi:MAG: FimV/HubP family polar landmark protein, partial [Thiohalocapsa sp.]